MYIVVYKRGEWLNCETQYIGPFESHDAAYDCLCELPAPGEGGVKFTQEVLRPLAAEVARDNREA